MKTKTILTDHERLDWLEKFVVKEHCLSLHDGVPHGTFKGLGLAFGKQTKRSLRDAIDTASGMGWK